MPRVLEINGFVLFFFSNEGNPREPMHIHVRRAGGLAKIWLIPEIELVETHGFSAREQRQILKLVQTHESVMKEAWNEYFG